MDGVSVPLRFGEIADEYAAFTVGAALVDRSHLGRVEQSGADAIDLLHRLSTADIESLAQVNHAGRFWRQSAAESWTYSPWSAALDCRCSF